MPTIAKQQFWNGLAQSDEHRNETAQALFDIMLANPEKQFTTSLCGDAFLIAVRRGNDIIVTDCIIRRRTRYHPDGTAASYGV